MILMPKCPTCGEKAILDRGGMVSLLGYDKFVGDDKLVHDHNSIAFVFDPEHRWLT